MAGCTITTNPVVIKDASGKDARGVAVATIVKGRHMIKRLTNSVNSIMTSFTQFIYDTGDSVVETFSPGESASIVAHTAIRIRCRVVWRFT